MNETPDDALFKRNKKIRVKLSGDGTTIEKRLHVFSFTYTILDEGVKAYSYEGNHPLAIYCEHENYTSLKNALEDIIKEVEELLTITTLEGNTYSIEYFLDGDWRFLATVTGM